MERQDKHDDDATVTRLHRFIEEGRIKPSALAARAGISRQRLLKLMKGAAEPTRDVMVSLTLAAGQFLRRRVFIAELFELGESEMLLYGLLISAKMVLATMPEIPPPTTRQPPRKTRSEDTQ